MPNTDPPITDISALQHAESVAKKKACCDYALFVGANSVNVDSVYKLSSKAAGLKMYLNNTFGPLLLESTSDWAKHIQNWPDTTRPICVHAEAKTLPAVLYVAALYKKRIHVCHVARKSEIEIIVETKKTGLVDITCEVAPHHLFATCDSELFSGNKEYLKPVKPPLMYTADTQALWDNLEYIDVFATDHAPHTLQDKRDGSPGYPGLQTALPLLLTAVNQGRLTLDDIVLRYHTNPKRIFGLPDQPDTYIEVDLDKEHTIRPGFSKCGWTPFDGMRVVGSVKRVVLRGKLVYVDGTVVCEPGYGENMRKAQRIPSVGGGIENIVVAPNRSVTPERFQGLSLNNVLSVSQFDRDNLRVIFDRANILRDQVKEHGVLDLCKGKVLANVFYEPSTRTRCSFATAMKRLGGQVTEITSDRSSVKKGESVEDFMRCMEQYTDLIVLRSSQENSMRRASSVIKVPLINAGNGSDEHPTQALLDAYTIRRELGTITNVTVGLVGDLKYGRTVHSLAKLLALYDVTLMYISPKSLRMPKKVKEYISENHPGTTQEEHVDLESVISKVDILYVTRTQKERFESVLHYEKVKDMYVVTPELLAKGKESAVSGKLLPIVMHPLPRNAEISTKIDSDPRAAYFRQMENGMYIRMALIDLILNKQ
jgi:carbamoyl-phosphate synthase/aspartate carbamoyltransferase/dihydroorotase